MNYKAYIYIATMLLSAFALSGLNFDAFIKSKKAIEARVLAFLMCIGLSYIVTNFITDFLSVSAIIKG